MNHSLAIHLQSYVVQVVNSFISPFISSTVIVLCAAVVFAPKTESGYWSWHPVKRLLVVIFLIPYLYLALSAPRMAFTASLQLPKLPG